MSQGTSLDSFSYDKIGNFKAKKGVIYTYDATGYRVGRDAGGVLTDYVYWGNNLLYETTSGKAIDYIWVEGKLLAKVENSGTTYFHHDVPQLITCQLVKRPIRSANKTLDSVLNG